MPPRKRRPCSEFFLIRILLHLDWEWRDTSISPYSVRIRENADQKNSEYGHFSCSPCKNLNEIPCYILSEKPVWTVFEIPSLVLVLKYSNEPRSFNFIGIKYPLFNPRFVIDSALYNMIWTTNATKYLSLLLC